MLVLHPSQAPQFACITAFPMRASVAQMDHLHYVWRQNVAQRFYELSRSISYPPVQFALDAFFLP
jgi:hypothetical protein